MKRCPKCNSEYREESRFCPRDGVQLESIPTIVAKPTPSLTEEKRQYVSESLAAGAVKLCPQCGSEFPPKARFCYRDGSRLQEVPITADGDEETQPEEKVEKVEQKETNQDKLIGRTIGGHYKLVKKIGQGGMAVVYKAEHVRISRPSAIKILNPDLTGTPELIERFEREAEMASRINHPNAAGIYDVGEEEDGLVYITMEFVDGDPLSKIIKREGPLPLDRVVNIIRQVADALDAAHQLHIVHRDMKPDNIMVCRREGKPDWVKVVDFGIAKQARHGIGYKALTQRGVILGTPEYMSPEQLLRKPLDPRSDIYSLGLVVFKALTGKAAFEGLTPQARMIKKLSEPPMALSEARPGLKVSPQVEEVLRKALDPEPDLRYQTVLEFAADLEVAARSNAAWAVQSSDAEQTTGASDSILDVDIGSKPINAINPSDDFPIPPPVANFKAQENLPPVSKTEPSPVIQKASPPSIEEELRETRPVPAVVADTREHQVVKAQPLQPTLREMRAPSFDPPIEGKRRFTWKHYTLAAVVLALLIVIGVVYARLVKGSPGETPPAEKPTDHSEQQSAPQQETAQAPVEVVNDKIDAQPTKPAPPKTKTPADEPVANANKSAAEEGVKDQPSEQPPKEEQPKETEEKKEPPPEPKPEEKPPVPAPRPEMVEGQILNRVAPIYPSEAKARRVTGEVVVEVEISKKGKVKSARVISGHVLLREAALTAARAWKFAPTTLNGEPIKSTRTLVFRF
ncbi:MAG TPA: TonB family protein, partial [Blastocatellia bacterium]